MRAFWIAAMGTMIVSLAACVTDDGHRGDRGRAYERPRLIVAPEALLLMEYDTNHDRIIDRAELEAGISRSWQEVSHGANEVSLIALRDWLTQVLGAPDLSWSAMSFDHNFDGHITAQEFHDEIAQVFDRLDIRHDNRLTRGELLRQLPQMEGPRSGSEQGGGEQDQGSRRRRQD